MNDPHSLPENSEPERASGFLGDDWHLSKEKSSPESACLFDGKIIARMPDLGSLGIAKSIKKPQVSSFWRQTGMTASPVCRTRPLADVGSRQRFFRWLATFGGIVLLCGVGILFIGKGTDKSPENTADVIEISVENAETPVVKPTVAVEKPTEKPAVEMAEKTPVRPPARPATEKPVAETAAKPPAPPTATTGASSVAATPVVPVASVESVAATVNPPKPVSPWDRPTSDAFAMQESVPKQTDNPPSSSNVVAAATATSPTVATGVVPVAGTAPETTVPMSPMTPINTASMPVSPYEMPPVSPFELQLVAQSNVQSHSLSGTQMQPNYNTVSPGVAPQQNIPWQVPEQRQFPPPVQGQGVPVNHVGPVNSQSGQYGQQNSHVVPPGYVLTSQQQRPQSVPIPSSVSTLPIQGGQPTQPYGVSAQPPHSDFYNAPPAYRRVY